MQGTDLARHIADEVAVRCRAMLDVSEAISSDLPLRLVLTM